jgi:hypothetical protein
MSCRWVLTALHVDAITKTFELPLDPALAKDTPGRPARTVEIGAAVPTNLPGHRSGPGVPGDALRA